VTVVPLEWSTRLGGGWETWCDECGSVWVVCTQDELELDLMQHRAEEAALLHEDNDHAPVQNAEDLPVIEQQGGTKE
jgi:hypothetical protein